MVLVLPCGVRRAVATIAYQPSAVVGEIVATAGGTTINLLAGDFVDVVVSTGTAYRPPSVWC